MAMAAVIERRVLRFYGVKEAEVRQAAERLAGRCGLSRVDIQSCGAETLLALAAPAPALRRAEGMLRRSFGAGLYGTGAETLADCTARALAAKDRLLACADTLALELLAPRLEGRPGIDRIFDFGAGSCADPAAAAAIEAQARRCKGGREGGPAWDELCRLRAALHVTRSDLAAGALALPEGTLVLAAGRKGCWAYLAAPGDNAALRLLDLLRRAAAGSAQAEGVRFVLHGEDLEPRAGAMPAREQPAAPSEAAMTALLAGEGAPPAPLPRRSRWPARLALVLLVLLAAGLAAAFQATGGDLAALPDVLRSFSGAPQLPAPSGAALI